MTAREKSQNQIQIADRNPDPVTNVRQSVTSYMHPGQVQDLGFTLWL